MLGTEHQNCVPDIVARHRLPQSAEILAKAQNHEEPVPYDNYEFGKGQYAFYPIKLSCFAKKNEVRQKYHNYKGGPLRTGSEASLTNEKLERSFIFWEGSGHPNFMNPFENDK